MFTHNNWTLSDEFVRLIQSNDFYRQHVRWDVQRFRPGDVINEQANVKNVVETSQAQPLHLNNRENGTPMDNMQDVSQQQQQLIVDDGEEEETTSAYSATVSTKRKFDLNERSPECRTRTQPRRLKKN